MSESRSVAGRSPVVDVEDGKSPAREELLLEVQRRGGVTRRAAVS